MIIFNGVETYINLYFIQWIYRAIENKSEFTQVFAVIGLSSITLFGVYILEKYIQKVIRPKIVTKISAHIYMDVLDKNVRDELRDLAVHTANYEELRDLEEREKRKEKEHSRE